MSSENRISIMIVDDHVVVREAIAEVLNRTGEFEVVGQARDGEEALVKIQDLDPDVVIMDILLPNMSGIETCREITNMLPNTRVLMLTASNNHRAIVESVNAGATGYLQKYSGKDMLLCTLKEVANGEFRVQGEAARRLVTGMRGGSLQPVSPRDVDRLTAREREILRMFALGKSYAEIAEIRGNNPMTIRNAVYAIQRKLDIGSRQELGVWAARSGLLDDEELR